MLLLFYIDNVEIMKADNSEPIWFDSILKKRALSVFNLFLFTCAFVFLNPVNVASATDRNSISSADIQIRLGDLYCKDGSFGKAETAFTRAIALGYNAEEANLRIGYCGVKFIQNDVRVVKRGHEPQRKLALERIEMRDRVLGVFSKISPQSRYSGDVKYWMRYVKSEVPYEERDFPFADSFYVEEELCFIILKQAYDSEIFTGQFRIEDPNCRKYKDHYDNVFRSRASHY